MALQCTYHSFSGHQAFAKKDLQLVFGLKAEKAPLNLPP